MVSRINKIVLPPLFLFVCLAGISHAADGTTHVLGAKKQTLDASTDTVKAGYYPATKLSVVDANLSAGNIKSGVTIFGHAGTLSVPASQTLDASTDEVKAGVYSATWLSAVDPELNAENIKSGVTIFGHAGAAGSHELPDTGQLTSYAAGDDGAYYPAASSPSYTLNGDGTTTDNRTGLIWEADGASSSNWATALTDCQALALPGTGWHLPNIKELISIVDYNNSNPAINGSYFTNTQNAYYWTSTTFAASVSYAYIVSFGAGYASNDFKSSGYYVRCVRGGSGTQPSVPQSLAAVAGDQKITLTWSAPSSDGGSLITNYKIYRGASSGSETYLETVGNVLTYDNTSLTNGVPYYYKVTVVNGSGESGQSNEASATPVAAATPFCTVVGDKNTHKTIGSDVVYCDNNLKMWTPTAASTYKWGTPGIDDGGSCVGKGAGYPACNYCDSLNYAGFTGWQLPTLTVLESFWTTPCGGSDCAYPGNAGVSWDTNANNSLYWSSTEANPGYAQEKRFWDGDETMETKDNPYYVRCVRVNPG